MEEKILKTFEDSLARCNANPGFLDRFYEVFLESSPRVKEKFVNTDFVRQKRALKASLHAMLLATGDGKVGLDKYLSGTADRHSRKEMNVGAEFYDYWLDSLLATVKEIDPKHNPEVQDAWEKVMMSGISYLLSKY